jgi:Zn-finger protein
MNDCHVGHKQETKQLIEDKLKNVNANKNLPPDAVIKKIYADCN